MANANFSRKRAVERFFSGAVVAAQRAVQRQQ